MNTESKTFQCRHIFTDGHRCGSPCLRNEPFCYYHHTTRKPAPRTTPTDSFDLPLPEDRSAIQSAIGTVLQRIAAGSLDPKRAGLLLYGLQIASLNLPKQTEATHLQTVEDITVDEQLGTIAPESEVAEDPEAALSRDWKQLMLDVLNEDDPDEDDRAPAWDFNKNPVVLPDIQAVASPPIHREETAMNGAPGRLRPVAKNRIRHGQDRVSRGSFGKLRTGSSTRVSRSLRMTTLEEMEHRPSEVSMLLRQQSPGLGRGFVATCA
jgi:hypothetical protein